MIRALLILLCFSPEVVDLRGFSSMQNHFGAFNGLTVGGIHADTITVDDDEYTVRFGYRWIRGYFTSPPEPRWFDFDRDFDVDLHDYKVFLGRWHTGVS